MDDYEMIDMNEQLEEEPKQIEDRVIKCILFENGTYIISEIEEITADYGMPNCRLTNPYQLDGEYLSKFPKHCKQSDILMSSDKFLTIYDPSDNILDKYVRMTTE
ncbi:hypothetical protein EB169_12500 [archaeon]|jgi:hypothetical protein|nr:hypothetical protein [archaeon]